MKTLLFVLIVLSTISCAAQIKAPPPPPLPADVIAFKHAAQAAGADEYDVVCYAPGKCRAVADFLDGSRLRGDGSTRQEAEAAVDFTKVHPAPFQPPKNYRGRTDDPDTEQQ